MLRITLAALCLLLVAVLAGVTVGGTASHQTARSVPISGPQVTLPLRKAAICRANEKQCRMASYITWCCRPDQQCDYSTVGGCR